MVQNKFFLLLTGILCIAAGSQAAGVYDFSQTVQKVLPGVVSVIATAPNPSARTNQEPQNPETFGSGFVIDPKGLIVTSNHNIVGAEKVMVLLFDGAQLPARVVATDTATDLALLRVDVDEPLLSLTWGDDAKIQIGEWVLTVGNPYGLGGSVTAGIISAKSRDLSDAEIGLNPTHQISGFLQTDASISIGSSGGPMVNLEGEVIGVNTVLVSPTGGSIGLGFAIPATIAQRVIDLLQKYGHVPPVSLGVELQTMTPSLAEYYDLKQTNGALIVRVDSGSSGGLAGLRVGDVLLKIDGEEILSAGRLPQILTSCCEKKEILVTLLRAGQVHQKTLYLKTILDPLEPEISEVAEIPATAAPVQFHFLSRHLRHLHRIPADVQGVLVPPINQDGWAEVFPNSVLRAVNNKSVTSPAEAYQHIEDAAKNDAHKPQLLLLYYQGKNYFAAVR